MSLRRASLAIVLVAFTASTACRKSDPTPEEKPAPQAGGAAGETYPAPRWPSYFKPAKDVAALMPAARSLVRNTSGFQGKGMGILQAGEAVLIVPTAGADPMVVEAITTALKE